MSVAPPIEQHPGFTLIRVAGAPYERGFQHGSLLRDGVRRLRDTLYRDVINFHGRAMGLTLQSVMAPILKLLERHIPPEYRLEMRGVAAGAGVRYWDILIFNCFDDMLHALWLLPPLLAKVPFVGNRFACSSFALLDHRAAGGRLLHGRNLDYEVANGYLSSDGAVTRALKEHVVVVECAPDSGQPFTSVTWPGFVGVVTGLNRAGLSLACLTSTLDGETPNGVPLPLLYRRILQYAHTLEESELLLRRARRTIGNNLLLASGPANDARVFELAPAQVASRSPRDGSLVTTNHFVHPALAAVQGRWVAPSSVDRQVRLSQLCDAARADPVQAGGFLRDTVSLAPDSGLWSCIENPGTIYSTLAEPASGRLWIRANDHPARDFVELQAGWARLGAAIA